MHHHRLVLNGPPEHADALARALLAAGAERLPKTDPPRLTWSAPSPPPLPSLCADHPRVVVGIERFTLLGDALERLVLRGTDLTFLERRPFAPATDDDPHPLLDDATLAQCEPLPPPLVHAAASLVAAQPTQLGPNPTATAVDDALMVGIAIGDVCTAAMVDPLVDPLPAAAIVEDAPPDDSFAQDPFSAESLAEPDPAAGPPGVLAALAALSAAALTAAAAAADPATPGELALERAHHLTEAHAIAARERLWSRPGDADWPEWLMYVLLGAVAVIEDCAVALHQPPPPSFPLLSEHSATRQERLVHSTTRLVATCLQALALFAPPPPLSTVLGPTGCARN